MSEETKNWWQSRTIIGVIVLLLAQVLKYFKVDIVNEELTDIVVLVMDFVGASLAIYGRVKARKTIKRTKPGGKFNPNAEVRRAKPVRAKFLGIFLLFIVAQADASELRYPAYVWHDNPLKMCNVVDQRPFLVRLLDSLVVSIALFPIKGEVKGNADF
jgi:uncharacterized membrane protein